MATYTLPDLPYDFAALEPHISARIMELHHDKHHAAYVAGANTAQHTRPVAFADGTLTVQADSTAWAKQLQLMRSQILSEIVRRFPEAGVEAIRFIGPDVPSWKWGPRAIPGRGPRDTYG